MNFKKSKLALITIFAVASLMATNSAFAASSVKGKAGGYDTSGSISINSNSATANTSAGGSAFTYVEVTYNYKWGDLKDSYSVTKSNNGNQPAVSVTATSQHANPLSVYATATHKVQVGTATWTDYTNISY